ncbi:uncharacterized protein TEOVI_000606300 [Trypanosoma equiperdum]|uniref:RNA-binding protein n=2 Tax=Trypanozoon TaxID=39700 RepID=Q382B5_TRYB2|nr:hypothetical protein, conserved [Trypanosoma brucei brucei TREU927]EAN80366.1 hypothetical protein, conserved [Trypanosoma brucei brucei TREU927]SCU73089.1 hypothetical protein, conserved [Trypanosoma equiperdum]
MDSITANDYDTESMKGLYNVTLEVTKSPSGVHSDNNGDADEAETNKGYKNVNPDCVNALAANNSRKQEEKYLAMFNDFNSHNLLDVPDSASPPRYQPTLSGVDYTFSYVGSSPFASVVQTNDADGTPEGRMEPLSDAYPSANGNAHQSSANEPSNNAPCVYASIETSPLQGRRLNFRAFLTKKTVPTSIMKEGQAGVFVGQLPSTYTEEDTAALLRAIGDDAGVPVHVRDVKSHNQSRTCAFVTVNQGALQVLLGYSKRVLCDSVCVWVVEPEKAQYLKDFVDGLVRERLRGVPKAALVLEQLTPQYVRGQASGGKEWKGASPHGRDVMGPVDGFFMAMPTMITSTAPPPPPPNGSEGQVVAGTHMPMSVLMPSWGAVQQTAGRRPTAAPNGSQVVGAFPGANIYGNPGACFIAVPPPGPVAARSQQVNLCVMAPGTGAMQPVPYVTNYAGGNMYAQAATAGSAPATVTMQQAGTSASPVQVGMGGFGQQVAGGSTVYLQSVPPYALHQVLQQPQQ